MQQGGTFNTFAFLSFATLLLLKQYRGKVPTRTTHRSVPDSNPEDVDSANLKQRSTDASKSRMLDRNREILGSTSNTAAVQLKVVIDSTPQLHFPNRFTVLRCELSGVVLGTPSYVILRKGDGEERQRVLVERDCLWFIIVREWRERFGGGSNGLGDRRRGREIAGKFGSRGRKDWIAHGLLVLCVTVAYHVAHSQMALFTAFTLLAPVAVAVCAVLAM